jgi:hypothetical protein
MKTATSLTLIAIGAILAFAISAHISWLNLPVIGWILILTGVAGAIITRSTWLRRTVVKRRPAAAAAERTAQRPPPSQRLVAGRRPAVAPDAAPAKTETIEEYVGV